jgi:hypothetical protein
VQVRIQMCSKSQRANGYNNLIMKLTRQNKDTKKRIRIKIYWKEIYEMTQNKMFQPGTIKY